MTGTTYRTALVLGMGVSGRAAAKLMLAAGTHVTVVDEKAAGQLDDAVAELEGAGATAVTDCVELPVGQGGEFEICVTSPGVAADSDWHRALRGRGVPIISELELGWRHLGAPVLAVTGTNGKSTLVKLCSEALSLSGLRAVAAGNYGRSLSDVALAGEQYDWVVAEVSSFQLETVSAFRPRVGVVLNVQPDHLDRHGSMAAYRALKARLFAGMGAGDTALVREEDSAELLVDCPADCRHWTFGTGQDADFRFADDALYMKQDVAGSIDLAGTAFANPVMGVTAAAAAGALAACGADAGALANAIAGFDPLPHRMTCVGEVKGVRFVDDSKATNVAALAAGLKMVSGPVRLVAGGLMKGDNPDSAKELLASKVRKVYLIGDAADAFLAAWNDTVPCCVCGDLERATMTAFAESAPGETVLLSPGCASFDQFQSYAERGDAFQKVVRSIDEES